MLATSKRPSAPTPDGVFGIDFWHAVEFSRIGRAPRSGLSARSRGNRSNLPRWSAGVKLVPASHRVRVPLLRDRGRGVSDAPLGPPRERPPNGVRHSLPGDVENSRQSPRRNTNRLVSDLLRSRGPGPRRGCACRGAAPATRPRAGPRRPRRRPRRLDPGVVEVGAALGDRPPGRALAGRQPGGGEQVHDQRPAVGGDVDLGLRQLGQRRRQRAARPARSARRGRTAPGWRRRRRPAPPRRAPAR